MPFFFLVCYHVSSLVTQISLTFGKTFSRLSREKCFMMFPLSTSIRQKSRRLYGIWNIRVHLQIHGSAQCVNCCKIDWCFQGAFLKVRHQCKCTDRAFLASTTSCTESDQKATWLSSLFWAVVSGGGLRKSVKAELFYSDTSPVYHPRPNNMKLSEDAEGFKNFFVKPENFSLCLDCKVPEQN